MTRGARVAPAGALALFTCLLAACGGGSPSAGSPRPGAASPTTVAASGSPGSCSGASDPRLQSVVLSVDASSVTATWTSTGTDNAASASWAVTVSGGSPHDYQLIVAATSGVAQSYVFNVDTGTQVGVHAPGKVTVTPGGATETFPMSDLPGLGSAFTWNAVLNIDGTDVAYCPADETFLAFQPQR